MQQWRHYLSPIWFFLFFIFSLCLSLARSLAATNNIAFVWRHFCSNNSKIGTGKGSGSNTNNIQNIHSLFLSVAHYLQAAHLFCTFALNSYVSIKSPLTFEISRDTLFSIGLLGNGNGMKYLKKPKQTLAQIDIYCIYLYQFDIHKKVIICSSIISSSCRHWKACNKSFRDHVVMND